MRKKPEASASKKTVNLQKASMSLDDFVWTLQKINIDHLKDAADALRLSLEKDIHSSSVARTYQSGNENKDFLIGVLPRLFQDKTLFPQNDDITEFASSALGLETSRAEKRSRYEIIGKLVVEMSNLDDKKFAAVAHALEALIDDKDALAVVIQKKREGSFSWNETIQKLLADS